NKGKVTVLHPDKIGRRQRGATEACFLHVARKRRGSRLPRLPGGEQLLDENLFYFFSLSLSTVTGTSSFFEEIEVST
ncbi:MAG: hypothetical protein OXB88_09510, partial [Bacteriovoracales bacterium]|nr:hypothetical protein [Bacteriovoracales bacterium]